MVIPALPIIRIVPYFPQFRVLNAGFIASTVSEHTMVTRVSKLRGFPKSCLVSAHNMVTDFKVSETLGWWGPSSRSLSSTLLPFLF